MSDSSIHPSLRHNTCDDNSLQLISYFSCCLFCILTCMCLFLSITTMCIKQPTHNNNIEEIEGCMLDSLRNLRLSNAKKVTMGHLNINSIPNEFTKLNAQQNNDHNFIIHSINLWDFITIWL